MLEQFMGESNQASDLGRLQSLDLEYGNLDPDVGLFFALCQLGETDDSPISDQILAGHLAQAPANTRAALRSHALRTFPEAIEGIGWRAVTFRIGNRVETLELPPNYGGELDLASLSSVESFVTAVRGLPCS
jgi:proteasome accessory factor A